MAFLETMKPRIQSLPKGYDAYYIKFNVDDETTYWIRYELVKKEGKLKGEVWFIAFIKGRPAVYEKEETEDVEITDEQIRIGESVLKNNYAKGKTSKASWEISWEATVGEIWYYPRKYYDRGFPFTEATAPFPSMKVSGFVEQEGEKREFSSVPGELGHHWGKKHGKNWFYYHANAFEKPYMVLGAGSKIGLTVNIMFFHDGEKLYSHEGLMSKLRNCGGKIKDDRENKKILARFWAKYSDLKVTFEIEVPYERIIGVTYDDPAGPVYCYNSMVADGRLIVERKGGEKEVLEAKGKAAFEIGTRKKIEHLPLLL